MTCNPTDVEEDKILELFTSCDLNGSGYIEECELSAICQDLTQDEVSKIFKHLDNDGDGRISFREFSRGFESISEALTVNNVKQRRRERMSSSSSSSLNSSRDRDDNIAMEWAGNMGDGFSLLSK